VPRYIFKPGDLSPLRAFFARPDAQRILSRAIPVKVFNPAPKAVDAIFERLPVKLRTRNNPDGVPLGDVNALTKARVPGVRSVVVRDGTLLISWATPPTSAMRENLKAVLSDKKAFDDLQDKVRKPPPMSDDELRTKLLTTTSSDAEWLRLFRRYQMSKLSSEPGTKPGDPGPRPIDPTPGGPAPKPDPPKK
jgi:hypothetical protein